MKPLIIAIIACTWVGIAPSADARHGYHRGSSSYTSGYRSCATPVYTQRYLVGYDAWGRPIWRYRNVVVPRYERVYMPPRYIPPYPRYRPYCR